MSSDSHTVHVYTGGMAAGRFRQLRLLLWKNWLFSVSFKLNVSCEKVGVGYVWLEEGGGGGDGHTKFVTAMSCMTPQNSLFGIACIRSNIVSHTYFQVLQSQTHAKEIGSLVMPDSLAPQDTYYLSMHIHNIESSSQVAKYGAYVPWHTHAHFCTHSFEVGSLPSSSCWRHVSFWFLWQHLATSPKDWRTPLTPLPARSGLSQSAL